MMGVTDYLLCKSLQKDYLLVFSPFSEQATKKDFLPGCCPIRPPGHRGLNNLDFLLIYSSTSF